jgi:hypothetical protein
MVLAAVGYNVNFITSVEMYNVSTSQWTGLAQFPGITDQVYNCVANNRIFVFGGMDGSYTKQALTWEFDLASKTFMSSTPLLQATVYVTCIAY